MHHVLVTHPDLFSWQYQSQSSQLNFMLAINEDTNTIGSLIGFIPTSHFDPALQSNKDVWGAIWKSAEGKGLVGLQLLLKMQEQLELNSYSGIGLSEDAQKIYTSLKYKVGVMEHYYIANENKKHVLLTAPCDKLPERRYPSAELKDLDHYRVQHIELKSISGPQKSATYLYNRYATHPYYNYVFFSVEAEGEMVAVIVARVIHVDKLDSSCLRIVDWYGNWKAPLDYRDAMRALIDKLDCEYVDLVCKVDKTCHFQQHGFKLKDSATETIPNYFEPFMKENVNLKYVYNGSRDDFVFFKGDADQDRPNRL